MKGIVVTTDNSIFVQEFGEPLYKTVGEVVGGYIEVVHPMGLPVPYCMIVNEEGLLMGLPENALGCALYYTWRHGNPIVGNIVVMKEEFRNGDRDITGLSDEEAGVFLQMWSELMKGGNE